MAQYEINFKNNRLQLSDGDELKITQSNGVKLFIASVGAGITVSLQLIEGGSFRNLTPTIPINEVREIDILPIGAILKFTGGDVEVWVCHA